MSDEFDHLFPAVRPIAALGAEERVRRIRADRWVDYPLARAALAKLEELIAFPPVRAGLPGLANGSLLHNFALAAALARLNSRAGRLRGGGARGRRRGRARAPARGARSLAGRAPATGPSPLSRPCGGESERLRGRGGPRAIRAPDRLKNSGANSSIPLRLVSGTPTRNLHEPRSKAGAKALSSRVRFESSRRIAKLS